MKFKRMILSLLVAAGLMAAVAVPAEANYVTPRCHPYEMPYLGASAVWWDNQHFSDAKNVYVYGTAKYGNWVSEKVGITDISDYYPRTFWYYPPAHPAYFLLSKDAYRIDYGWKLPILFAPDHHVSCHFYVPAG
jgi:hypothetical protein